MYSASVPHPIFDAVILTTLIEVGILCITFAFASIMELACTVVECRLPVFAFGLFADFCSQVTLYCAMIISSQFIFHFTFGTGGHPK